MTFDILHRWTRTIISSGETAREAAEKGKANLRDANLSDANLRDANLSDADLSDANLRDADLRGANLRGANLRDANLRDANLRDANLRDANLSDADLRGANLRDANLSDADLSDADLRGADLRGADLRGAPIVEDLDRKVHEAVTASPSALNMATWHACETTHCRAGWAITLAGEAGKALESEVGSAVAGTLIYLASTGRVPSFYAANEEAREDIARCAADPGKPPMRAEKAAGGGT